jgi:hypothetical protein
METRMANNLCSRCVEDNYLKGIITAEGVADLCDSCNEARPHTISIGRLGKILEGILRERYVPGEYGPRFVLEDDHDDNFDQAGDDLAFIIQDVLGQYFDFNEEIVAAVIEAEDCSPSDGDIPFFEDTTNYVQKVVSDGAMELHWNSVEQELRTKRRFFSSTAKHFFDNLFADLDSVLSQGGRQTIVSELPEGFIVFRSRICGSMEQIGLMLRDPIFHVGPPPPSQARAGRMNAEGISVFYGSFGDRRSNHHRKCRSPAKAGANGLDQGQGRIPPAGLVFLHRPCRLSRPLQTSKGRRRPLHKALQVQLPV